MNELLVGYARVSTEQQDLTAQRNGLHVLGVGDDRIYVDHGLTGTNRDRPGLRLALAACRAGDTLVVTKLDRLARSLPDARDILDELTKRNVKLSLCESIHDPTDPVGRLLFNMLAMVAEFEAHLIRLRTAIHGVSDHRADATQATGTGAAIRTFRTFSGVTAPADQPRREGLYRVRRASTPAWHSPTCQLRNPHRDLATYLQRCDSGPGSTGDRHFAWAS
jgi:hypothetical protein